MGELGFGFGVRRRLGAVDLDFDLGRRRPESKVEIRKSAAEIQSRNPKSTPRTRRRAAGATGDAPADRPARRGNPKSQIGNRKSEIQNEKRKILDFDLSKCLLVALRTQVATNS